MPYYMGSHNFKKTVFVIYSHDVGNQLAFFVFWCGQDSGGCGEGHSGHSKVNSGISECSKFVNCMN